MQHATHIRRQQFAHWINTGTDDAARRAIAFMRAIRTYRGRAWVWLDRPVAGMPPIMLGL